MRKRLALLLLLKLSGLLLLKASAQSQLSLEHYYSMSAGAPLTMMPVAGFQLNKGFYAEGRYNYEELNTLSFYMGRTFSKESKLSYTISPIAGAVIGDFNGGSIGANVSLGYKNFYIYSQPQYTFSLENAINNFIYSWTDITYSPRDWLSVGVSLQHTKPYKSKGYIESGLVIETAIKKFSFPIYIYNPQSKDRSFVLGTTIEFNFKKKKVQQKESSDPFQDTFPVKIIANAAEKKDTPERTNSSPVQDDNKSKASWVNSEVQQIAKVRRVNIVVFNQEKTETDNRQAKTPAITAIKSQAKDLVIVKQSESAKDKELAKVDNPQMKNAIIIAVKSQSEALEIPRQSVRSEEKTPTEIAKPQVERAAVAPTQSQSRALVISSRSIQAEEKLPVVLNKIEPGHNLKASKPEIKAMSTNVGTSTVYNVYYALLLGPFKSEADAIDGKSKLINIFNRDIVVYSESSLYKLRIKGFEDEKAAEIFRLNAVNEGLDVSAVITSYKQKNIEAIPLKGLQKPFEATQVTEKQ